MSRVVIERLTKRFEGKPPTVAVDDLTPRDRRRASSSCCSVRADAARRRRCAAWPGLESADEGVVTFGGERVFDSALEAQPVAGPSQHRHGVPVVRAVAAHDGAQEHRLPAEGAQAARRACRRAGSRTIAAVVDCGELLDRYPGQLSGGQQQRVALARGLVARPDLVLFDEPLSNLDARLREQVRNELAELHNRLGFTAVYVTHDQSEALALGDRLAIMRHGPHRAAGHAAGGVRVADVRVRRRVHRDGQPDRA